MVPLGSVATVRDDSGPYRVVRYNLYPAAELQGDTKPGFSSGQALDAMEKMAKARLPDGFGYEWTELAYPAEERRQHRRRSPSAWRWCSSSCCWRRSTRA